MIWASQVPRLQILFLCDLSGEVQWKLYQCYLLASACEEHLEELDQTCAVEASMALLGRWLPPQSSNVPDPWKNCYETGKNGKVFRMTMRSRLRTVLEKRPDGKSWLDFGLVRDPRFANDPQAVLERRRKAAINRCKPLIKALREVLQDSRPDDALRALITVQHLDYDRTTRSWEKAKKNIRARHNM